MIPRLTALALLAVMLGCAAGPRAAPDGTEGPARTTADAKRELLAAMERELEPLQTQPVSAPQARFTGTVEAAAPLVIEDETDFTLVDIPIGTRAPIKCFVYRDSIDVGQSLQAMIGALGEDLQIEAVRPTEIAAAGDRPALFMELDYTSDLGNGARAAGQVKLIAAPDDDLPLVCFHDEVGYGRTFRRITRAFAASIAPAGAAPKFAEIQVFQVNERPVGFEQRRIWDAEQGQTIIETTAVLLMPKSKKEFAFQDTVSTVVSDAKGRISQYAYAKAINGELTVQATMERQQGNTYAVQGTREGKEFRASFQSKDPRGLPSDVMIHREVKGELLRGRKPQLVFEQYQPSTEPTALREVKYRKTDTTARGVTLEMDGTTLAAELDEHGTVEHLDMPLGNGGTMRIDRVLAQGTP